MKAAAFEYVRAKDVSEAVKLLASQPGDAKVIAGGQSLGPMLNLRLARPKLLVDVMHVEALKAINDEGDAWRIGSGVTHAQIEDGGLPGCKPLAQVACAIAYRAIRNRGTLGGSLAHADPAADWPLAFSALGAYVRILGPAGKRDVACDTFSSAAFSTDLEEDEIIEAVYVPKLSSVARWGYYKLCRKTGEFPHASAAVLVDPMRRVARVFAGSLDGPPRPLRALASHLASNGAKGVSHEMVEKELGQLSLNLASVLYKLHATAVCRSIQQAFSA